MSSIDFGDYSFTPNTPNRRVSAISEDNSEFYNGPGINKIPGRIQTLNPYMRDELASASFGGFQRRPAPKKKKNSDCDYYTDSLCLEVTGYPT